MTHHATLIGGPLNGQPVIIRGERDHGNRFIVECVVPAINLPGLRRCTARLVYELIGDVALFVGRARQNDETRQAET